LTVLAFGIPVFAGLLWHQASDNPIWPLVQNSLNICELRDTPRSPLSPDGLYRVHIAQVTCLGRFSETLLFITDADAPWSLAKLDHNRAVLEAAGLRSLDAVEWQPAPDGGAPRLQLWFAPGAFPTQIHRLDRLWRAVIIQSLNSSRPPGAERLDY